MAMTPRLVIQKIKDVTVVNFNDPSILDPAHIEQIGAELYDLIDKLDRRKLVLDFSDVQFLSSQTLGVLVTMRRKADAAKSKVVIAGLRPELYKIFKITRLESLFSFFPDEQQALQSFGVYTT
jgi:anti-sigma B factor antagonist